METITRRKFIAGSAAFSAITVLKPGTVFGSKANSAIRLGIIGCGNRGSEVITEMVKQTGARIIAMGDLFGYQADKVKSRYDTANVEKGGVAVSRSKIYIGSACCDQVLGDPDVDAVLVSSPAYTHPGYIEKAVTAGKHVYCEKPAAPDVAGCRKVIRAGENTKGKVSLAIGFQIRYASPYVEMAKRIQRGDIGEIVNVQLYYISSGTTIRKPTAGNTLEEFMIRNHFHFTELSGGIFLDQAIHIIDVCNWVLTQRPDDAIGKGNLKGGADFGDTFTNYQVIFGYPDDVNVSVHSTQLGPAFGDVCARFIGTKGIAEAHYGQGVFISGENQWDSGVLRGQEPTPEQKAAGIFTSSLQDSTQNKVKAFIQSIESGQYLNEALSGATSTMSAILGRMTASSGKPATWDEMYYSNQQYNPELNLKQFD